MFLLEGAVNLGSSLLQPFNHRSLEGGKNKAQGNRKLVGKTGKYMLEGRYAGTYICILHFGELILSAVIIRRLSIKICQLNTPSYIRVNSKKSYKNK